MSIFLLICLDSYILCFLQNIFVIFGKSVNNSIISSLRLFRNKIKISQICLASVLFVVLQTTSARSWSEKKNWKGSQEHHFSVSFSAFSLSPTPLLHYSCLIISLPVSLWTSATPPTLRFHSLHHHISRFLLHFSHSCFYFSLTSPSLNLENSVFLLLDVDIFLWCFVFLIYTDLWQKCNQKSKYGCIKFLYIILQRRTCIMSFSYFAQACRYYGHQDVFFYKTGVFWSLPEKIVSLQSSIYFKNCVDFAL